MAVADNLARAGRVVITGVVGVGAYDLMKRLTRPVRTRDVAVASMAWGLRAARSVEKGAEGVRLGTADLVAEAKERIGEQVAPPGVAEPGHDHEH